MNSELLVNEWVSVDHTPERRTRLRKCSYCSVEGHKITECNRPEITQLYNYIKRDLRHGMEREEFMEFLSIVNEPLLRVFAIQYCGVLANSSYEQYFHAIVLHFYDANFVQMQLNLRHRRQVERLQQLTRIQVEARLQRDIQNATLEVQPSHIRKEYNIVPIIICTENEAEMEEPKDCTICFETFCKKNTVITNCNHFYCKDCMVSYLKSISATDKKPSCAMCRCDVKTLEIKHPDDYFEISNVLGVNQ